MKRIKFVLKRQLLRGFGIIFCVYLFLALFSSWSDRRILESVWFLRDLRYWLAMIIPLVWGAVTALTWRIVTHVLFILFNARQKRIYNQLAEQSNAPPNAAELVSQEGHERTRRRLQNIFRGLEPLGRVRTFAFVFLFLAFTKINPIKLMEPLFVIPGLFVFFVALIIMSRGAQSGINMPKGNQ